MCTGCRGSEDTVWEARGAGTVHQGSQLYVLSESQTHHTTLRDCSLSPTHAGR